MAFSVIDSWVAAGTADAVAAAVVRPGGEVVERRLAGRAEERSLFALASLTKPIVALAAMVAAEEGAVDLDRPIADHLAAYADPGRRDITLRHLLSHTSGLPEVGREVAPLDVAPVHRPATRRIYSNVGFHIVAALLTAATGMPFQRYVDEAVLAPLGLDAWLPLPEDEAGRAVEVRDPGLAAPGVPLFNSPEWRRNGTAAGGAFASLDAVVGIARVLLDRGAPLMARETFDELADVQYPGLEGGLESFPKLHCPDWGLGLNVRGSGSPHWAGDRVSARTLSHFGASGTLLWADPLAAVALVCLANRGTYSSWMLRPGGWIDLSDAVVEEHGRAPR